MNEDLERRLQAMRPADIPPELQERICGAEPVLPRKIVAFRFWIPLAAAAAAVAIVSAPLWPGKRLQKRTVLASTPSALPGLPSPIPQTAPASNFRVFVPISQSSTLLDLRNVAVIDSDPARPVRYMRATWIDDVTYQGDDGRTTMRRSEPRSEIIPMPIDAL